LPTFDEMVAEFGVSRSVLQRAIRSLREDGFIRSVDRQGLFVSDAPPHLCQFALLFPNSPCDSEWSRMNAVLLSEAQKMERERADCRFVVYSGLRDVDRGQEVLARLRDDVEHERLAGIIALPGTLELMDHFPFSRPSLPKVHVCAYEPLGLDMTITVDGNGFYQRAMERLVAKGRKRVAIVHMADTASDLMHQGLFEKAGLELHGPWIQWVGRSHPEFAAGIVSLLLDYPPDQRPDGLIVGDDNLAEHVAAGIIQTGLRVGEDLDVVAHCNWPWPLPSPLPFERIGFSITELLERSVDSIAQARQGGTPPALQAVPALFEWEVLPAQPQLHTEGVS
jgi:DNA-binding LacI/PurR family transcriptional regulator/DNA-binding transcriptional regulator YhcF (GntR family)